jgi:hypothetical protein
MPPKFDFRGALGFSGPALAFGLAPTGIEPPRTAAYENLR